MRRSGERFLKPQAPSEELNTFPSRSRLGVIHRVYRDAAGVVWCTCPRWRFQNRRGELRDCAHTRFVRIQLARAGARMRQLSLF